MKTTVEIADSLLAAARRLAGAPPVRWAYLIWRAPWMAVRDDTFVSALLDDAGGANVCAGAAARYPQLLATFVAATRLETAFWDMGWRAG